MSNEYKLLTIEDADTLYQCGITVEYFSISFGWKPYKFLLKPSLYSGWCSYERYWEPDLPTAWRVWVE